MQTGDNENTEGTRKSEDKKINATGKKLMNLCNEMGGKIKNGDTKGDWEGNLTYIGEVGHSVLDLVVELETEGISIIDELRVVTRTESDHLPVAIYLDTNRGEIEKEGSVNEVITERRLYWDDSKKDEYRKLMEERGINIQEEGLAEQARWENLINEIWEVAYKLNLVNEGNTNKKNKKKVCKQEKEQRKAVFKCLKKWLETKNGRDKFKLKMERVKLKKLRKRIKEKKIEENWREIEESKTMEEFWQAVGNFRPRKKTRKGINISKKDWEKHFKKLLGVTQEGETDNADSGEGWRVEVRKDKEATNENQERESRKSTGVEGLNRDIETVEVKLALKKMKNKKAAGEDGLKVEFLKYLPNIWIKELTGILNGIWEKEDMIKGWEVARIYPIYKAGDEELAENYRGVALLNVGYKLLTNILAKRISSWCENKKILRESGGFQGQKRDTGSPICHK